MEEVVDQVEGDDDKEEKEEVLASFVPRLRILVCQMVTGGDMVGDEMVTGGDFELK